MSFHNPYHFIPVHGNGSLDDKPVTDFNKGAEGDSEKSGHLTHDRYLVPQDAAPVYSGRLLYRLETESPTVVGAKQRQPDPESHTTVEPFELENEPALPASTLRGMLSSVIEAASNSAMRVLENIKYSVRAGTNESFKYIGLLVPDGTSLKVRPICLPTFSLNNGGLAQLEPIHTGLFTPDVLQRHTPLRVFLNGYSYKKKADRMEVSPGSFLDNNTLASSSADHSGYWYMQLPMVSINNGNINANIGCHVSRNGGRNFLTAREGTGVPINQSKYDNDLTDEEKQAYTRGFLRILGIGGREKNIPHTKTHELFIPYPQLMENVPLMDADHAIKYFHILADQRTDKDKNKDLPYQVKGANRNVNTARDDYNLRLRAGDIVYFNPNPNNHRQVKELAISSIWRKGINDETYIFFEDISKELLPFNPNRETISIAEQMFGFVEYTGKKNERREGAVNAKALRSRLRFADGRLSPGQNTPPYYLDEVTLKILASPKPPCPDLYFTPKAGPGHIPKSQVKKRDHTVMGRKRYLHHKEHIQQQADASGRKFWETSRPEELEKLKSNVKPLREGLVFFSHIDFDNLNSLELGLLLHALSPTPDFSHKLGMGKSLGLGTMKVEAAGLFWVDRQKRYDEDDLFGLRYHQIWTSALFAGGAGNPFSAEWRQQYPREAAEAGNASVVEIRQAEIDTLVTGVINRIDPNIAQALKLIGEPGHVRYPVHTPQLTGNDLEKETFQWFVNNQKHLTPKHLTPITQGTTALDVL